MVRVQREQHREAALNILQLRERFFRRALTGVRGGALDGPSRNHPNFTTHVELQYHGAISDYVISPNVEYNDVLAYFSDINSSIQRAIHAQVAEHGAVSFYLRTHAVLVDIHDGGEEESYYPSAPRPIMSTREIAFAVHLSCGDVEDNLSSQHAEEKSGYRVKQLLETEVHVDVYEANPRVAPAGQHENMAVGFHIPLSEMLANKQFCINIKTVGHQCIRDCLELDARRQLGKVTNETDSSRPSHKPQLDWTGITFPMHLDDLDILEERHNLAIHAWTDVSPDPLRFSPKKLRTSMNRAPIRHVHLFIIQDRNAHNSHAALIVNLHHLINSRRRVGRHNNDTVNAFEICDYCTRCFRKQQDYLTHILNGHCDMFCSGQQTTEYTLPEVGSRESKVGFRLPMIRKMHASEYVIYLTLQTIQADDGVIRLAGFSLRVSTTWGRERKPITYLAREGENAVEQLVTSLAKLARGIYYERIRPAIPLTMTEQDERAFDEATHCYLCTLPIAGGFVEGMDTDSGSTAVRDHHHRTGAYLGAAHHQCNLQRTDLRPIQVTDPDTGEKTTRPGFDFVPVIVDTLGPLHRDILTHVLTKTPHGMKVLSLPIQRESDWISYSVGNRGSLGRLTFIPAMSFLGKDNLQTPLPAIGRLTDTDRDSIVQRLDAAGKARQDAFEAYRWQTISAVRFDPTRFITVNQLGWHTAQYLAPKIHIGPLQTFSSIELLDERHDDVLTWLNRYGTSRGGINFSAHRMAQAAEKEVIVSLDVCRCYPYILLAEKTPVGEYSMVHGLSVEQVLNLDTAGDYGYHVTVDVEAMPDHLSAFPPLAHHETIEPEMLSEWQVSMLAKHGRTYHAREHLLSTLTAKRWTGSLKLLQYAVAIGVRVSHVAHVVRYKQDNTHWTPVVEYLHARINAGEKHLKQVVNALYGLLCQDKRKQVTSVVISSEADMKKKTRAHERKRGTTLLSNEVALLQRARSKCVLDVAMLTGLAVQDLSKLLLLRLYYDVLLPIFGSRMSLIYIDTDSLLIHLTDATESSWIEEIKQAGQERWFHWSSQGAAVGVLKLEGYAKAAVVLYRKCYSATGLKVKAAGVPKTVLDNETAVHRSMCDALTGESTCGQQVEYERDGVKNGVYQTISEKRTLFVPLDFSRWTAEDGISTYAWGDSRAKPHKPRQNCPCGASHTQ